MAQTMVIQVGANGLTTWYIDELSAAVAEPAHATLARAAQARMLASYRLDPGGSAPAADHDENLGDRFEDPSPDQPDDP